MNTNDPSDPIEGPAPEVPVETPIATQSDKSNEALVEMSTASATLKAAVGGQFTDVMADWLVSRYATAARAYLAATEDPLEHWRMLRLIANDLGPLRRSDHSAARLALQRAKFEDEMRQAEEERQRKQKPKPGGLSRETLEKIERELKLF